jgi:hypothetical protein
VTGRSFAPTTVNGCPVILTWDTVAGVAPWFVRETFENEVWPIGTVPKLTVPGDIAKFPAC